MSRKAKRILSIIFQCTVVALLIAALLYYIHWPTRVDLTLNAVKLDENGNQLGTEEIRIKGYRLDYLFRESRLDVQIEPFGTLKWVKLTTSDNRTGVIDGFYVEELEFECFYLNFYGWDTDVNDTAIGCLYFTEEFDRLAIAVYPFDRDAVYYVASVSGNYSIQEIIEHFHGLVPGP